MFSELDSTSADALVIDLRMGDGGHMELYKPLIDGIIKRDAINKRGHLFVIIGRRTFAAGQGLANELAAGTEAILVGEPSGSKPKFLTGGGNFFELPYSQLVVHASDEYISGAHSGDKRKWLAPDLVALMQSDDFRVNRDPSMEAVRAYRQSR
jgi:hypothetical protein